MHCARHTQQARAARALSWQAELAATEREACARRSNEHTLPQRVSFLLTRVFGESGLLENEPTVPAESRHTPHGGSVQ